MTQISEHIFFPVITLILGTLVFTAIMGITRLKAARSGAVDYRIFKLYRNRQNMPDTMLKMNNHYDNLMTMPILFYLIVTMIYVTHNVDNPFIILAWVYVITRLVHSFIHLGQNHPLKRFFTFGTGVIILFVMTIRLALLLVT